MDKSLMLEQLISYYANGNKAAFAAMVGVTPQLLSNWLKRKTFDAEQLYTKCKGVSADWLLSGEGCMVNDASDANAASVHGDATVTTSNRAVLEERAKSLEALIKEKETMVAEKERLIKVYEKMLEEK